MCEGSRLVQHLPFLNEICDKYPRSLGDSKVIKKIKKIKEHIENGKQ